eukprot:XP_003731208.2 PREDICTED: telomere repeats-binding bouquet formation protein 1 isoform X1 [Strongylocentrotus purpuratus]
MDLKTDLDCLIECLRYCSDDATKARDTIITIASLCSGSDEAQNLLRISGGLSFIVNLLSTTPDEGTCVAALYALGCATERNVFSQSRLCTEAMFKFLYCQLTNEHSGVQMKRTTTFLIMCLVTNNGKGQTLVRKTKCLDALLQLFRQFPGLHLPYHADVRCSDEEDQKLSLELWKDVTGTLCGCVNNPQNDENQLVCASSIPAALYIMSHAHASHVIQLLCSYISLLAANNAVNQDRFHMLGGLGVIVSKLTSVIDDIIMEPEKGLTSSASNMISMLSSVVAENDNNLQALAALKVVPLLLKLLALEVISQGVKLKVIITLGCLVSADEGSKKQVHECDGLKLLLGFMMANQDEECAKAATLVLHSCINFAEEEIKDDESQTGDCSSENEGQAIERPLMISKGQHKDLEAKIDILQKTLQEERRLRKSLEDEKATLPLCNKESNTSASKEDDEASTCTPDLPPKPHPKPPASSAEHQGGEQQLSRNPDISIQSPSSFVQLQERMNALEQKLRCITSDRSEIDMNNNTTISETSDSESAEDVHRSVSEAENDETKLPDENVPEDSMRRYKKATLPITKQNAIKEACQQQVTTEKDQSKEMPLFKVPPPIKRFRPLDLVRGNMSIKKFKSISPGMKPLPPRINHRRDRGEVTPSTKVQTVDLAGLKMHQESLDPCVLPGSSSGKRSRKRRSSSSVYRTLTYNGGGGVRGGLIAKPRKAKQMNQESDSDADSECSDVSEVSSIADSVFSSLNVHLSCPIRPVNHNPPPPIRHIPSVLPAKQSPKVVMRPMRSTRHMLMPERRNVKEFSKKCGKDPDTVAKSKDSVFDFEDGMADSKKESSHRASSNPAIHEAIHSKSYERHSSTHADPFTHDSLSDSVMAKLKATPKIMLKKASLKGKNLNMYIYDGKHQAVDSVLSSDGNKQEDNQGLDEHLPFPPTHHNGYGSQKEPARIFTSRGSGTKGSGSKTKSYSVHYVRGKIQCSRLYRGASRSRSRTPDVYSSTLLTCPGCVPPRHRPLLDSHTLLPNLLASRHGLCRKHNRLIASITSYISSKMNLFGL